MAPSLARSVLGLCALFVFGISVLLASPTVAHAGDEPRDVAATVGAMSSGLPGLGRVGVAAPKHLAHAAASLGLGYGVTEARQDPTAEAGAHHRAMGSLAVMAQPLRFLAAALVLDGRYDKHPDDAFGSNSSAVGEPRLFVRASKAFSRSLAFGAQLGLWIPGGEAPSLRPKASTLDAQLLATYAPQGTDLVLALNTGYRLDQSAETLTDAERPRLRRGDRLSLNLSDFNAVLLGAGASKRLGGERSRLRPVEVLGEITWDILVGRGAPTATQSPLRLGFGARYHVREEEARGGAVQIELRGELALSARAPSGPTDALVPTDPRFAMTVGLRWVPAFGAKTSPAPGRRGTAEPARGGAAGAATAASGAVNGRVTSESGEPIPSARVVVTEPPDGAAAPNERSAETGADGSFTLSELRVGRARVVVTADGYEDATAETTIVEAGAPAPVAVSVVMKKKIRPGQLRGLVRSFSGKPLAATIRVEPIGVETKTDADGTFRLDVPPGAYEVVIAAPGHAGQRRPVQLEENGVTILNADLRPGKGGPP